MAVEMGGAIISEHKMQRSVNRIQVFCCLEGFLKHLESHWEDTGSWTRWAFGLIQQVSSYQGLLKLNRTCRLKWYSPDIDLLPPKVEWKINLQARAEDLNWKIWRWMLGPEALNRRKKPRVGNNQLRKQDVALQGSAPIATHTSLPCSHCNMFQSCYLPELLNPETWVDLTWRFS